LRPFGIGHKLRRATQGQGMSDVFVSYKAEDRRRIRPLVQCLQADGYSVWWDEHIGAGDTWRETIERELDGARCVLVIWSKRSIGPDGGFVREEASRAQRRGVYVPVLIDPVDPPLGFGEKQATSIRGWKGDCADGRYQAVLSAVRRIAGPGSSAEAARPAGAASISRRTAVAGGVVAVLAVGSFGTWKLLGSSPASASNSIAVLPFTNLSGDPKQAYFSDGVAEEIRSALTRLGGLTVIGSSSSEAVRNDDAKTAATKLGVANILTGSVRETPSTIRITAELIDGRTGADRWTQDYDRSPGDTIKIQTDIAANVATALKGALGLAARAALSVGGTQNPEAQRLVLQSGNVDNFSRAGLGRALELINQAIALDPNYADAYARKARILTLSAQRLSRGASEEAAGLAQAEAAANRALELAPNLPAAHDSRAAVYENRFQLHAAQKEFEKALSLAPDDPTALTAYANFLASRGEVPQALRIADKLSSIEPVSGAPHSLRAFLLYVGRRYPDALAEEQRITREWPEHAVPLLYAQILMQLGRDKEAPKWLARGDPASTIVLTTEAILSARAGDTAGALSKKARLVQLYGDRADYSCAQIDAQLGRKDEAFSELGRAWAARDSRLLQLTWVPWLDPLRSDPRYAALVRKIGLPS
jgi:serine/threonine-protein kinase